MKSFLYESLFNEKHNLRDRFTRGFETKRRIGPEASTPVPIASDKPIQGT